MIAFKPLRQQPVSKATDLAQAAELLAENAQREGYRVVGVHPLFQYAAEAGDYQGSPAVVLELDAPRLSKALLEANPQLCLVLPLRMGLYSQNGRLFLCAAEPEALRTLLPEASPEAMRALDWLEVTQEILFNRLA